MNIVEKIIASIQSVVTDGNGDPLPVYYNSDLVQNMENGRASFPCVTFQLLTSGYMIPEGMQYKEQVSAGIFFADLSEFDFDGRKNEVIIDECKKRALSWLGGLPLDKYIEQVGRARTERIYAQSDDILTGFGVFIDIKELNGFCEEYETPCTMDFSDDFNGDFNSICK